MKYSPMLIEKERKVQTRKDRIEKILRSLDCDLYPTLTALTEAIARRYNEIYSTQDISSEIHPRRDLLSGSTLRRKNSPYRTLVASFYKTEERIKIQLRSKEAQLAEENLILRSELAAMRSESQNLKAALENAHQEIERQRLNSITSRTASGVTPKYSDAEIMAYKAILLLFEAGRSSSGFEIKNDSITQISLRGDITIVDESRCPLFFSWYKGKSR